MALWNEASPVVNMGAYDDRADLAYGRKRKPARSGQFYVFGDSISQGVSLASPATTRFGALVAAAFGGTETNLAISGSCCGRWFGDSIASRVYNVGDVSLLLTGYNDARYGGANLSNITMFRNNLVGTACALALPDSAKVYSQLSSTTGNPAMTFSGAWTFSSTNAGGLAQSRCGAYSTTPGDWCQATFPSECDTAHVMLANYVSFASQGNISVNGTVLGAGNFSAQPLIDISDAVGGTVWQPYPIRITNLPKGIPKTIRLTNTSAANLMCAYMAGYDSTSSQLPMVYIGNCLRMTTVGYATAPANSNDTNVRTYQTEALRVAEMLSKEGLFTQYVDVDGILLPSAASTDAGQIHPLEHSHSLMARKYIYEINRPSVF
jgi:hypothetical protein